MDIPKPNTADRPHATAAHSCDEQQLAAAERCTQVSSARFGSLELGSSAATALSYGVRLDPCPALTAIWHLMTTSCKAPGSWTDTCQTCLSGFMSDALGKTRMLCLLQMQTDTALGVAASSRLECATSASERGQVMTACATVSCLRCPCL